jgi:hypothetical protein
MDRLYVAGCVIGFVGMLLVVRAAVRSVRKMTPLVRRGLCS